MENKIYLYTIDCPACKVLEQKLIRKGIDFVKVSDIEILREKGLEVFPVLEVEENKLLSYGEAVRWVNNCED